MKSDEVEEIKRHFGVVAEGLQSQLKLAVEALDAKIDVLGRDLVALREETRRGFAETQAMIKFSYAELDRRVSSLETIVSDLDTRLRRVEGN